MKIILLVLWEKYAGKLIVFATCDDAEGVLYVHYTAGMLHVDGAGIVLHGVGRYYASTRSFSILEHVMAYCLGSTCLQSGCTMFSKYLCIISLFNSSNLVGDVSTNDSSFGKTETLKKCGHQGISMDDGRR